jgi:hypothetical protein
MCERLYKQHVHHCWITYRPATGNSCGWIRTLPGSRSVNSLPTKRPGCVNMSTLSCVPPLCPAISGSCRPKAELVNEALMCNRIWIRTFWTFCPICVQFDVRNIQIFSFLLPFILLSPARTLSWCLLSSVNSLSSLCAALPTYSTPSCKPITRNRVLNPLSANVENMESS